MPIRCKAINKRTEREDPFYSPRTRRFKSRYAYILQSWNATLQILLRAHPPPLWLLCTFECAWTIKPIQGQHTNLVNLPFSYFWPMQFSHRPGSVGPACCNRNILQLEAPATTTSNIPMHKQRTWGVQDGYTREAGRRQSWCEFPPYLPSPLRWGTRERWNPLNPAE